MNSKTNREPRDGGGNGNGNGATRRPRGFAAMNSNQQREIARKGGQTVSRNRDHMAEIGRKGGEASRGGGRRAGGAANR